MRSTLILDGEEKEKTEHAKFRIVEHAFVLLDSKEIK